MAAAGLLQPASEFRRTALPAHCDGLWLWRRSCSRGELGVGGGHDATGLRRPTRVSRLMAAKSVQRGGDLRWINRAVQRLSVHRVIVPYRQFFNFVAAIKLNRAWIAAAPAAYCSANHGATRLVHSDYLGAKNSGDPWWTNRQRKGICRQDPPRDAASVR